VHCHGNFWPQTQAPANSTTSSQQQPTFGMSFLTDDSERRPAVGSDAPLCDH
jgi:hypothetical protein